MKRQGTYKMAFTRKDLKELGFTPILSKVAGEMPPATVYSRNGKTKTGYHFPAGQVVFDKNWARLKWAEMRSQWNA